MNGFCPENYLNLLKHYLYGEYINEYLTFYEASFNYTKQAVVSGRPFFICFGCIRLLSLSCVPHAFPC